MTTTTSSSGRWLTISLVVLAAWIGVVHSNDSIEMILYNGSNQNYNVFWIHPTSKERHPMHEIDTSPLTPEGKFPLKTFVGHTFEIQEVCTKKKQQDCRTSQFTVATDQKPIVLIKNGLILEQLDQLTPADLENPSSVEDCAKQGSKDEFVKCVQGGVAKNLVKVNEAIAFHARLRTRLAESWENYTCYDEELPTSPSLEDRTWAHTDEGGEEKVYDVHIMHERPSSRIHIVDNFITRVECDAMEAAAKPKLHQATVADGKGGSELTDSRKALQAGIRVPWEDPGHPIAMLSRRVYDYSNHVLGLNIDEHGQEDLMSIQYFGRGADDEAPDRYKPHCDGDCRGLPHKSGTRMATMVMYCDVPDVGGATNFRNSGVHVVPKMGSATYFAYINPENEVMDAGFTEHSGCPVLAGEKKIVTQWIRYGVDSKNPWDSFNTLGIKHSDASQQ